MSSRVVLPALRAALRRRTLPAVVLVALTGAAAAPAAHGMGSTTAAPGTSLSAIAAANGVSLARMAAANGLPIDGHVMAGQAVRIPPADGFYTGPNGETLGYATSSTAAKATGAPAVTQAAPAAAATAPPAAAARPSGGSGSSSGSGVSVTPGDTLSAIAARIGSTVAALAAANGISDPNLILAGTTLRSTTPGTTVQPAPSSVPASNAGVAATSSTGPEGAPAATGSGAGTTSERVTSQQVAQIASNHGVPGNLAAAIAWQESGNNNALTSSAGARGVMQIMPGTWDWINASLASPKLRTHSAADNVRAGSLFLRQLLRETGGDEATAIAGYYQGLGSVRERGLYDDTKQYVSNVQAIKSRLGG